jgi:hypothetical protein
VRTYAPSPDGLRFLINPIRTRRHRSHQRHRQLSRGDRKTVKRSAPIRIQFDDAQSRDRRQRRWFVRNVEHPALIAATNFIGLTKQRKNERKKFGCSSMK